MYLFSHIRNMRWGEEKEEVEGKEEANRGRTVEVAEAEALMELLWEDEDKEESMCGLF